MFNGGFMLLASLVSYFYNDGVTFQIFIAGILTLVAGAVTMLLTRDHKKIMNKREGYIVVTFGWIVMSLSGTLPYMFTESVPSFYECFFRNHVWVYNYRSFHIK